MHPDDTITVLRRSCWHCSGFGGFTAGGVHARCIQGGGLCIVNPLGGCSRFDRVPGSDDSIAPPAGFSQGALTEGWRAMIAAAVAQELAG